MIRKMTQIAMLTMFALSLIGLTASAQKTEKQGGGQAAQPSSTKELGKKESANSPSASTRPTSVLEKRPTAKIIAERRPTITIHEVTKKDSAAKQNPNGAGLLVPVDVRWDAKLPAGAKLVEMKCILKTKNTDGKTSVVEQLMAVEKFVSGKSDGGTISLPMPEGVFAKDFTLTLVGKFRIIDNIIAESVTKSGSFPIIAR